MSTIAAEGNVRGKEVDYAAAGRELLARVNLENREGVPAVQRYSNYNALWRHPDSGGTLYVGNATTASQRSILDEMKCRNIVFCQESDGKMHFADDPEFTYLAFPIGSWQRVMPHSQNKNEATMQFFQVSAVLALLSVNAIFGCALSHQTDRAIFLATF